MLGGAFCLSVCIEGDLCCFFMDFGGCGEFLREAVKGGEFIFEGAFKMGVRWEWGLKKGA